MQRVATFSWRTPPPTSVDEELALYDDGTVRLVVRRPRGGLPAVGTYAHEPDKADFAELTKAGADGVTFDLRAPIPAELADAQVLASRVADEARHEPEATASFYGRPTGPVVDGTLGLSLAAVGGGTRTVEFDIDPSRCAVHLVNRGETIAWREFPKLETGFVTPDAEGLGGLGRRAEIRPGAWGVLLVKVAVPAETSSFYVQVAGRLFEALPDDLMGAEFEVRTEPVDVVRS